MFFVPLQVEDLLMRDKSMSRDSFEACFRKCMKPFLILDLLYTVFFIGLLILVPASWGFARLIVAFIVLFFVPKALVSIYAYYCSVGFAYSLRIRYCGEAFNMAEKLYKERQCL